MATMNLEKRRRNAPKMSFNAEHETIDLLSGIIPGLPRTMEEKIASVERGLEDYRLGRGITQEEFLKEQATWL